MITNIFIIPLSKRSGVFTDDSWDTEAQPECKAAPLQPRDKWMFIFSSFQTIKVD